MLFKVAASIFLFISLSSGSPLSQLHNNDDGIAEVKYKLIESNELTEAIISPRYVPTTYRLPNNSIPLGYDLLLTTDVDKGLSNFTGTVKIHIKIIDVSQEIVLHYRQTTIDVINLLSVDGTTVISADLSYEQIPVYEFLVITLPNTANPGDELVLEIKYTCQHRSDGGGFYRASYTNAAGELVWYATTQFEIDDARHAMPSYDEPGIRAPISVVIRHGKGFTAVSNTDVDTITEDGEYFVTKFFTTPRIQTYLLAFLVSDYEYVNATNTRIPQKIYARPELIGSGYGDFAATVVGPILRGLEENLGVNYPITKMDHAALTLFNFGAMENIGLITYTENGLLYNPNTLPASEESRKMSIIRLVAHEYVHQWFGNIVSPVWWSYVWLNEGFATLLQSYISGLVYPEMKFMNNFVTGDMPRAFSVDVLSQNSWAMNHYTEEPARLWDKFGGIGYQKSGCVLRMFQEVLTPSTFAKGLNYYLTKMYMQAATPDDLHEGLQRAYNDDNSGNVELNISDLMHTWEDQPGYPMITVQITNNNLVFSQRRYPGSAGEIYSVPITIATKSNANFIRKTPTIWLKDQVGVVSQAELNFSTNDWIILNIQQVGYYRVNYDTTIWHAIIRQLNENHSVIDPINRAVLQDEIYLALTDASLSSVNVSDCLNILSYFGAEDEPIAWSKANNLLNLLNTRLFATSKYEQFLTFLRDITSPHLRQIGYESIDYEPSVRTSLRASTKSWNCIALDDECFDNERVKLLQFYNTGTSAVFDYCDALRNVESAIYSAIVSGVATDSSYPSRTNYLLTLGCSLRKENLNQLLAITLDPSNTLTAIECQNVFVNTMRRSVLGLETTLEFIDENYVQINARIDTFTNILQTMASLINSFEYVDKFEALIAKLLDSGISLNASQIRIIYLDNIKWHNEHYPYIEQWFTSSPEPTTVSPTVPTRPTAPTSAPTQSTTNAPGDANSLVLSFGLFIACLLMNLRV